MRWREIALRLALIAGLFWVVADNLSGWITAAVGFAAVLATAELAVRPYAKNAIDKLLLGSGAVVTGLIVIGLGLTLTPWGLIRITADVAWLVVSLAVLGWRRNLRTRLTWPAGELRSVSGWAAGASLILAAAVVLAAAGVRHWDQRPDLAFGVVSKRTGSVVVEIEATSVTGRYRIVADSKVHGAQRYASAVLTVTAGGAGAQLQERVPVNIPGVWRIELRSADNSALVRFLIVNVS